MPSPRAIAERLILLLALLLCHGAARAVLLTAPTTQAFDRYVSLTEERRNSEVQAGRFLWIDSLAPAEHDADGRRLRGGEILIDRRSTLDRGRTIEVPNGLVHHWIGLVFIPGATLPQVVAVLHDYPHQNVIYQPEVQRASLVSRSGNDSVVAMRLYKKAIVSVVLDTEYQVHTEISDPTRYSSRSRSIRIAEVENAGKADERAKPVGDDNGFLWRLNSYWRLEQQDGGVYVQCEAVSLTRDVPFGLGTVLAPILERLPRQSLYNTLNATRNAVEHSIAK